MIKTVEELQELIKGKITDDTSTDDLNFWEDLTDTVNDLEARIQDVDRRIAEKEKEWKDRYIARFKDSIGNEDTSESTDAEEPSQDEIQIDDLFEEEEE